ncbi:hypothetical protein [Sphingopyxis solisilvae]|uniref:hypothetical protein n=1 Tax=Sphingopyxis solisilvae TaxID=1886788 RepID=UPI001892928C|nr:hypothetical protein [Sphingopyxis solisilvae]
MSKNMKIAFILCFAVIALISIIPTFTSKPTEVAAAPPPMPAKKEAIETKTTSPITNLAIAPYTKEDYPGVVAKFGSAIPAINADRKKAAEIAARSGACDSVQNSQVSRRSPKDNRHYWVECGNLTRLYFDETSLAEGEPVEIQTKADWLANGLKEW